MIELSLYNVLESAIILAIFSLFYKAFLQKETFFRLNRLYLLSTLLFATTVPFFNISMEFVANNISLGNDILNKISGIKQGYNEINEVIIYAYSGKLTWTVIQNYLSVIYILGVIISAVFFVFGLGKIILMILKSNPQKYDGYRIIETTDAIVPFSLFKWIIINPEKYSTNDMKQIIAHERMHAFQLHSFDLIFIEVLVILFWFNPFIYWYRKSIREVHEYLADKAVVENGFDELDYKQLLLSQVTDNRLVGLTSRFSYSLSKNRLKMLTMMKSKNMSKTKVLLAIPFAIAFIFFFTNSTEFAKATNNSSIETKISAVQDTIITEKDGENVLIETNVEMEGEVYFRAEIMPKFQGKESDAFRPFVAKNLKYPKEAIENKIQGTVYIQFDVDKEGNVRNAMVVRGVSPLLDAEALRVTNLSPKWTPAEQDGEKVNVRFTFPIVFKLSDSK
jgi:TonB family protein